MSSDAKARPAGLHVIAEEFAGRLLEASVQGYALMDAAGRLRYLNDAGARILGVDADVVVGGVLAAFEQPEISGANEPRIASAVIPREDGDRIVEFTTSPLGEDDSDLRIVTFWDVTAARQKERHFRAFARTASGVAFGKPVSSVLELVAREAQNATGVLGSVVMLIDLANRTILAGTAGEFPPDYAERVKLTWDRGAPLASLQAMESRRTVVARHLRRQVDEDARYAAFPFGTLSHEWDSAVLAPMIARNRVIGVLVATYGQAWGPNDDDVAFLTAMADQAAIAIDNAQLVGELEVNAALEERHRLARELHDSVSQALFSLTLQARAVELLHKRGGPDVRDEVATCLAEIRELTQGALAEMRALIFQLRPAALHEEGLVAAITKHAAATSARAGLAVSVEADLDRIPLKLDAESELFRLAQEAVQNVVKHAGASSAVISLELTDDPARGLRLTVVDDGVGFDPTAPYPGHLGLTTMRERASQLGGDVHIESKPGRTSVTVVVPDVIVIGGANE